MVATLWDRSGPVSQEPGSSYVVVARRSAGVQAVKSNDGDSRVSTSSGGWIRRMELNRVLDADWQP